MYYHPQTNTIVPDGGKEDCAFPESELIKLSETDLELLSNVPEGQQAVWNGDNFELMINSLYSQTAIKAREGWFAKSYTIYEQMLRRREYLQLSDVIKDDIREKTYLSLEELYKEAEIVAAEIRELRTQNS